MEIRAPDDFHHHLRQEGYLKDTVRYACSQFERVIVMPNLKPPITDLAMARSYYEEILSLSRPLNPNFVPLMTLYLTDRTTPEMIAEAAQSGIVKACKLYPAGATTNSDSGVTDLQYILPALASMEKHGLVLCIHGEVTDAGIDIFDREAEFLETKLPTILKHCPRLKIVLEHLTTARGVEIVEQSESKYLAATITAHHLLCNRNAIFAGGIRPDYYCLPILKQEKDRQALLRAATSGSKKFFLGTDSAPHGMGAKYSKCGCAGIFTAHAAMELYHRAFQEEGALEKLEDFASGFGADFYGLPRNDRRGMFVSDKWVIPGDMRFGHESVKPFLSGEWLSMRFQLLSP